MFKQKIESPSADLSKEYVYLCEKKLHKYFNCRSTKMEIVELKRKANWLRRRILNIIYSAGKGHIGGSLSSADILVALFYDNVLRYDPKEPNWPDRDRFILSKGHNCVPLYIILEDLGYFDDLSEHRGNRDVTGYPDPNVPGIELMTGSLGQGIGVAAGMALAGKMDKKDYLVVTLLGDGECYEGSVWESAMFAAHHKLDNLVAIIDRNGQCVTDFTENFNRLEPLDSKWRSFGWSVKRINGHSFEELKGAFKDIREQKAPLVIVADTVKGKGVSFMERVPKWHHGVPSKEEFERAKDELEKCRY